MSVVKLATQISATNASLQHWIESKELFQSGFRNTPFFLKSPTHWVFGGFIGFWALLGFRIFHSKKQLGSLLVDLAHQLSCYLDSPVF